MRLRSLLYVPAHTERFVQKAHERGADAVILDLEDAVPEAEKDAARVALGTAVPAVGQCGAGVFVRINATDRLLLDAEAAISAGADGLMLPKVSAPADLDRLPDGCGNVIAIVENAAGLVAAPAIAAHPRVSAVCLGSEDFAADTGAVPDPEVVRLPKLLLHYAAKAAGKTSLGLLRSVAQFDDVAALQIAAEEAAKFGFDGATCIHPKAVKVLNAAFSPSAEQLDRARQVLFAAKAAASKGQGAFMLDGEFIDAPVIERYRNIMRKGGQDKAAAG